MNLFGRWALAALIFVPLVLASCAPAATTKPTVVTTLFPLYDFARTLGGDAVEVRLLLPPGVEAHSYEPTPQDLVSIDQAGVFVFTGEAMEPWAVKVAEKARSGKTVVVDASTGIELAEEDDSETGLPWEWAGAFDLKPGTYTWSFSQVDGAYADPAMNFGVIPLSSATKEALHGAENRATGLFAKNPETLKAGASLGVNEGFHRLVFDESAPVSRFTLVVKAAGAYGVFTEHIPAEFEGDEHFLKDTERADVEPVAEDPEGEHHHHGGVDPHIWVDPVLAQVMVTNIERGLAKLVPAQAQAFATRANALQEELKALDQDYANAAAGFKIKTLVYGGHFAFGYLASRYGLEHVSPYPGFAPDSEPTPQAVAQLIETLKTSGLKTIYYEELVEPRAAQVIADQTGAKMALLNGAHNVTRDELKAGVTYLQIMRENLAKLVLSQSGR